MVILLEKQAQKHEIDEIVRQLEMRNFRVHHSTGADRSIIGILGDTSKIEEKNIEALPGVEKIIRITEPYKLASKSFKPDIDVFDLGKGVKIGGGHFVHMAGPCAIESYEQLRETAQAVSALGARVLRGGAFKPRTSPYSFQGTGINALEWMREIADEFDMLVVSEVMSELDIEGMLPYIDIFQIGTRNAQNFPLLKAIGKTDKAILLKRGMAMTIDEWLSSAEYILNEGNERVILCERGIRTFETAYRATLDIAAIPVLREKTHLPVIVDPSHAAGDSNYVTPLALAATAVKADGLIVEVHPNPPTAMSDAAQQLTFEEYAKLIEQAEAIGQTVGLSHTGGQDAWL